MAQRVKALVAEPDGLRDEISRTHNNRRELTPANCLLTSKRAPQHAFHTQAGKYILKREGAERRRGKRPTLHSCNPTYG